MVLKDTANGSMVRYEGEWVDGLHQGIGMMTWPNGQKYDGSWQKGQMHGLGVFRWQNGTCREGKWENGTRLKWLCSCLF